MAGEHFVVAPHWEWWILGYFFFAGISGGTYVLGTMLRLWGNARDAAISRTAFLISLPTLLVCPILLTIDLGQPVRFWHMLIDTGLGGPVFKPWSPMSLGAWALLIFGIFSVVMFAAALAEGGAAGGLQSVAGFVAGAAGRVFMVVGAVFGLFIAAYTGVLLAVSNQPVWSDTWTLGGLFLASALSGAAACVLLATRSDRDAAATDRKLIEADRYFILLELVLLVLFLITLGGVVSRVLSGGWILLWLVVLVGTLVPLLLHWRPGLYRQAAVLAPVLVLIGVVALRAVIIFSAQA
jgi:formate-dependent nitrite reductase membrane component NrfD